MNQWINEWVNKWVDESMNAVSESMIQQITECMKWKEIKSENEMTWKKWKWNDKKKANGMKWMNERTTNEWMNE